MALVSNAAASREEELRRLMPPPPPRPPSAVAAPKAKAPIVLDEDTYTRQLEEIIERDYFPELPKMANQLEWLRAVNSGDVREMQRAQRNIARRRAAAAASAAAAGAPAATPGLAGLGLGTPGPGMPPLATPGWGAATPGTGLLRTPAMTPMVGGAGSLEAGLGAAAAAAAPGPASTGPVVVGAAEGMSLDSFLQQYTSEDNASFQAILEEDNRRKRAKVRHHLERPDPRDPETRRLLLEGPPERPSDEFGTSGQAPMTLLPAPEPPVNALFYDSSQRPAVPLSAKEAAERALGPPKAINRAATRLRAPPEAAPPSALPEAVAAAAAAAIAAGLPVGAQMPGAAGGTVGYDPMATPALDEVLGSPLMTWGDIESTPLRLGADDMPVALDEEALMGGGGPSFRVQGLTEREQAAHRLAAAKAGSGSAAGRAAAARGATPLLAALRRATGTGAGGGATARGAGGGATPLAVPLSPAARQLAASIKAGMTPRGAGATAASARGRSGHMAAASASAAAAATAANKAAALGSGELDKQLRASYRSAAASVGTLAHGTLTPGALGSRRVSTPGVAAGRAATPGVAPGSSGGGGGTSQRPAAATPVTGAAAKAPRAPVLVKLGSGAATAAAGAGAAATGSSAPAAGGKVQSVTDDLLRL